MYSNILKKQKDQHIISCLSMNYESTNKYLDYIKENFNISDNLFRTLYISNRWQLKNYMKHNYNFDIDTID